MGFADHACVTVTCDGCGDECWDEGIPHFDSRDEAATWAKGAGWLITETRTLCGQCSTAADCEVTGHQLGCWDGREHLGIAYRIRRCDHCGDVEYDPPWDELQALRTAALVVNQAGEVL